MKPTLRPLCACPASILAASLLSASLLAASILTGCEADPRAEAPPAPDPEGRCALVSVQSDYTSARISLLDELGALCRPGILDSGSAALGLSTALSGDVVAGGPHPDRHIALVDRYPNGVITWLDPVDFSVIGQLGVNTGFPANPQDVAHVSATRAYVSRLESNPSPGAAPFDGGGDLLVIDPEALTIVDRVDLSPWAGADEVGPLLPRPGRMAFAGDRLWVPLHRLSRDFQRGGAARLLGLDPASGEVAVELDLAPLKNCTGIAAAPSGDGLWLSCLGVFLEGAEAQLAHSGVAYVDLTGEAPTIWRGAAADLLSRPAGLALSPVDDQHAFVTAISPLEDPRPDGVYLIDRLAGTGQLLDIESPAYALGQMWFNPAARLLLLPDGDPRRPQILRFSVGDDLSLTALDPTDPDPAVQLPPREIRAR